MIELEALLNTDLRKKIFQTLQEGDKTRNQIIKSTNTPWTTTYDNLSDLKSKGLIESYEKKLNSKRGRPPTFWSINKKKIKNFD